MADKPNILVVDDDNMVREFLARALPRFDFNPVLAASGRRALAMLRARDDIAAVLLDWMMPEMNGIDFLVEFRKEDTETPVIMLTARTGREDVIAAIAAGVSDYITKPMHLGKLILKLNALVEKQRPAVAPEVRQRNTAQSGDADPAVEPAARSLDIPARTAFTLLDVSETGCCVESTFALKKGAVLFLELPELAERIEMPEENCFPVRVMRCIKVGRRFRIGALFVGLAVETIQRLRRASISQGAFRYED